MRKFNIFIRIIVVSLFTQPKYLRPNISGLNGFLGPRKVTRIMNTIRTREERVNPKNNFMFRKKLSAHRSLISVDQPNGFPHNHYLVLTKHNFVVVLIKLITFTDSCTENQQSYDSSVTWPF